MNILCVDLGGTHCRFAHFKLVRSILYYMGRKIFPTEEICQCKNAEDVLAFGAEKLDISVSQIDFQVWGVAGLIEKIGRFPQVARLTNISLELDFSVCAWIKYAENFLLVNDFALQAFASLAREVPTINIVTPEIDSKEDTAPRSILGAGTGLGVATLVPAVASVYVGRESYEVLPSEGGHVDMAFYGAEEMDFARFASQYLKQERISAEDILSGRGLQLLHAYALGEHVSVEQAAQIMLYGSGQKSESLQLQLYARFIGRMCRHLALNTLCTGGIYLGGGVLMKNPSIFQCNQFTEEFFTAPAHMLPMLKKIPIELMMHDEAGLWGAAYLARQYILANERE